MTHIQRKEIIPGNCDKMIALTVELQFKWLCLQNNEHAVKEVNMHVLVYTLPQCDAVVAT